MNGDAYPNIARQLGVSAYPSIKWLKLEEETLAMVDYKVPKFQIGCSSYSPPAPSC